MKVMRDKTWKEYVQPPLERDIRLHTSHRWLAEFDWFLEPYWDYMYGKNYSGPMGMNDCRDEMRRRLAQKLPEE